MAMLFNDPNSKFSPEFFTALGAGLLSGKTWSDQLANGALGVNTALATQKQKAEQSTMLNKTVEMLRAASPELAAAVAAGTMTPNDAFAAYLKQKQTQSEAARPQFQKFDDGSYGWINPATKEVQIVGKSQKNNLINAGNGLLYDPGSQKWIQPPADIAQNQNEYGLTPVWVTDPKTGEQKLMVTSKSGDTKILDTQGMKPLSTLKAVDTGTGTMLMDPRTAYPVKTVPKDLAGAEAEKTKGKLTGEALQQLPATIQKADQAVDIIDKALAHPGRETATGLSGVLDPRNYVPGTDARDFLEYNKQIAGKAFLEAFESLKGGGQITEIEGQKATQAIARLSTAQSDQAYKQALLELRDIVESGKRRAQQMAGQAVQPLQPVNSGVTKSGVKFSVEP